MTAFNQLPEGTFCVSCGDIWEPTNAKTVHGAKSIAGKRFYPCVGGKIEVGITEGVDEYQRVNTVAVKRGFDKWTAV